MVVSTQIPVTGALAGCALLALALCAVGGLAIRLARERRRLLAESERRFEQARDMICVASAGGRVSRANPALEDALGLREEDLAGSRMIDFVHPDDRVRAEADLSAVPARGAVRFQNRWLDRGGEAHWLEWTASRVPHEGLVYCVARDVTDRRRLELEVETLSQRDPLTGVYNRSRFDEELSARILDARRHERGGSLLLIDLDRFKRVNDEHGRAAGDLALREVARVLDENTRRGSDSVGRDANGMVARLGGDEFAVLLAEVGPVEAAAVGERLVAALEDIDLTFEGSEVPLAISVGVASFDGRPGLGAEELMASADQAMYVVKASGGGAAARAS